MLTTTASNLAVLGGAPAFAEPVHVGRPNIGDVDRFLSLARSALERRHLTNNGPYLQQLERSIADRLEVEHCVAMSNGTVALELMLRASGLTGDVVVPSYTFIATAHAVSWTGLRPVFADVDPVTHILTPESVDAVITPATSAILAVHLWGGGEGTAELQEYADQRGIPLFFDAAHAFGSTYRGKPLGSFGKAATFSFHATKCFHTFEGGAVTTNDGPLAAQLRKMRNFGFAGYDYVDSCGTNAKMNEISAAMGLVLLDDFEEIVAHNGRVLAAYRRELAGLPGVSFFERDEMEQSNAQYVVVVVDDDAPLNRDELVEVLHRENILARKYFHPGCHRMQPYASSPDHAGLTLPHSERLSRTVLCLPTGTSITMDDVRTICDRFRLAFDRAEFCREAMADTASASAGHTNGNVAPTSPYRAVPAPVTRQPATLIP
jgi:dTDP-4-amino-4,6-dideoxygalactose transaminase